MKQLFSLFALFLFLITPAFSKDGYPRQKIALLGETLPSAPKNISVKDLEQFQKPISVKIFDPYNKNVETTFYGFYLKDLIKAYAKPDYKIIHIVAIDGYAADIPKAYLESSDLFLSYKDNIGYMPVDRMGPARIIAPVKGIINKDLLLKIGVYWIWQVKSFEIKK